MPPDDTYDLANLKDIVMDVWARNMHMSQQNNLPNKHYKAVSWLSLMKNTTRKVHICVSSFDLLFIITDYCFMELYDSLVNSLDIILQG